MLKTMVGKRFKSPIQSKCVSVFLLCTFQYSLFVVLLKRSKYRTTIEQIPFLDYYPDDGMGENQIDKSIVYCANVFTNWNRNYVHGLFQIAQSNRLINSRNNHHWNKSDFRESEKEHYVKLFCINILRNDDEIQ